MIRLPAALAVGSRLLPASLPSCGGAGVQAKEESSSFLKKRTKKLLFLELVRPHAVRIVGDVEDSRVFCFFFSKKTCLTLLGLPWVGVRM
jgi:hypothetical protein